MRTQKITGAPSSFVPRLARTLLLLALCVGSASAVTPPGHGDRESRITVTAVAGDVDVTMAGAAVVVRPDSDVALPARVVTRSDGTLGLTQAGTNITVSNDTDIEIPAEAVDGNLIARLVQHRGNVFYDVAPRDVGKLRVETPLLVAVIKGTQFNVAVDQDGTTISLFEGSLEIHTSDDGEVIELEAGEIAIRSFRDDAIRVVGMNDARVAPPPAAAGAVDALARADSANGAAAAGVAASGVSVDSRGQGSTERDVVEISNGELRGKPNTETTARVDVSAGKVGAANGRGIGLADVALDTGAEIRAARADVAHDTRLDLGIVDLGTAVGLDTGGTTADVGLDTTLDLGGTLDTGIDTAVDLGGVDIGLDSGVDLGSGTVGLDTGVDLGGALDVGLDTAVDLGGALDVGLDTSIDLGAVVDTGLDLGDTLDLSLDTGLDLGGALDTGLDLGGTLDGDVDLGRTLDALDLGGGTAPVEPPSLFDGLGGPLGRP